MKSNDQPINRSILNWRIDHANGDFVLGLDDSLAHFRNTFRWVGVGLLGWSCSYFRSLCPIGLEVFRETNSGVSYDTRRDWEATQSSGTEAVLRMKNSMSAISNGPSAGQGERARRAAIRRDGPRDAESLRRCGWEIGERRAAERYAPPVNHVGLAMVDPTQGFIHWHILPEWVEQARERSRDSWQHCRMVVRLYDVSYIHFTGLNAHRIRDLPLPALCGHLFFPMPGGPGTWQLAEVGFLLRSGEFLPAARSPVAQFARDSASPHCDHTALLVDDERNVEEVGNVWDQEKFLAERNTPRLRSPLRIGSFAFESLASGQDTELALRLRTGRRPVRPRPRGPRVRPRRRRVHRGLDARGRTLPPAARRSDRELPGGRA